jgi:hypothetical protein
MGTYSSEKVKAKRENEGEINDSCRDIIEIKELTGIHRQAKFNF